MVETEQNKVLIGDLWIRIRIYETLIIKIIPPIFVDKYDSKFKIFAEYYPKSNILKYFSEDSLINYHGFKLYQRNDKIVFKRNHRICERCYVEI